MNTYPLIDWTEHALHAAAMSGDPRQVERRIAQGDDVNENLKLYSTPSGFPAIAAGEPLLGRCPPSSVSWSFPTSCPDSNVVIQPSFVALGGLVGAPLHVAVCYCPWDQPLSRCQGYVEVIKVLMANGADLHASRVYEGTPLHDAVQRGLFNMAELLISLGADVNSKEEDQRRTPLHRAVAGGQIRMVNFLLSKGADVNAVADFKPYACDARIYPDVGLTPLDIAVRGGYVEIAQSLIDAGAGGEA
jgi:hypothetical protein